MIFVGVDWAEAHHDVCVLAEDERCSANDESPTTSPVSASCTRSSLSTPTTDAPVVVGIETDRGLIV